MKKVYSAIAASTLFLLVFQMTRFIEMPADIIYAMFLLSPFVMIGLIWVVLHNGEPSVFTFDERFYDDYDYRRNGVE